MIKIDYQYFSGNKWWTVFAFMKSDEVTSWLSTTMEIHREVKIIRVKLHD